MDHTEAHRRRRGRGEMSHELEKAAGIHLRVGARAPPALHDHVVAENRILRYQIGDRVQRTVSEGQELAEIGAKLGQPALAEMATVASMLAQKAWLMIALVLAGFWTGAAAQQQAPLPPRTVLLSDPAPIEVLYMRWDTFRRP